MPAGNHRGKGWIEGPAKPDRYFDIAGVRIVRLARGEKWVSLTRLAKTDKRQWNELWQWLKQSRPELADLLRDPRLLALREQFDGDLTLRERDLPHPHESGR